MYNIGDKVRVVNFGNIVWYRTEDGKYFKKDIASEVIGQIGIIDSKHDVQGKMNYSIDGIAGKHAWYISEQLELVSKNNN
jgi:hypothetical protein